MPRSVLVILCAVLLVGAAARPGGVSREGMTPQEQKRFDDASLPADCAVFFHYRASEEPASVRGRATAVARDEMYDLVMARQSSVSRAAVVANTEGRAKKLRADFLAGRLDPVAAMDGFALCDEEYRLGLIKLWDIPTHKETWNGAEFYYTREFVELCAAAYRHVGSFGTTALSQAAARAEGPATAEVVKRSRLPWPEAVALVAQRARNFNEALSDGRLSYDQLQLTVRTCDQQLGLSVDANARMTPAMCETTALTGLDQRSAKVNGLKEGDRPALQAAIEARCSISKYTLGRLRDGKCSGPLVDEVKAGLVEDQAQVAEFNSRPGAKLSCDGD